MSKLIEDVKSALPKLTWTVNGKTIKFAVIIWSVPTLKGVALFKASSG